MKEINNARLKVLLQRLQTIRKKADNPCTFDLYELLAEMFVAHMGTKQYCTLRTDEDKLEFYSGIICKYEQFPDGATLQRQHKLLADYLKGLTEGIHELILKQ